VLEKKEGGGVSKTVTGQKVCGESRRKGGGEKGDVEVGHDAVDQEEKKGSVRRSRSQKVGKAKGRKPLFLQIVKNERFYATWRAMRNSKRLR